MEIRNFVIIAHIDHGKSTLADRFLELTKTVEKGDIQNQYLDAMSLERERGITIRMHPVSMKYFDVRSGKEYLLNLIDTPGHVDFSYEVSRSLAAVEGAILLVDVTKGVQAQTISNLELAKKQGLVIIPVVNKIDALHAQVEESIIELADLLDCQPEDVLKISAKTGINIEDVLQRVVDKIPPPKDNSNNDFRALIFDSLYDSYKGVVAYVRIKDGKITPREGIYLKAANAIGESKEIGNFKPEFVARNILESGQIGYIATGIKDSGKVKIGDTIIKLKDKDRGIEFLEGYQEVKSVVFASLYPHNADDYDLLKDALGKLKLNDAALIYEEESKPVLGRGFRCGFLGMLHIEITTERLRRDFGLDLIVSYPSIEYKIKTTGGEELTICSPIDWPDESFIEETFEQFALLELVMPNEYMGSVINLMANLDNEYIDTKHIGTAKTVLVYELPLREIMVGFFDKLKSTTQGYASMSYKIIGYKKSPLAKLEILINEQKEETLSRIIPASKAEYEARKIAKKLKDTLPKQQYAVPIQGKYKGKIIARETISAFRKDVTGYLYGGDVTRKNKLLDKQKKGKKLLQQKGKMRIPPNVFFDLFKQD
ncbi:MAG TPA: translation elongation factor 4 [Candidatus Pacearchaeota archaeon]|nr:translation elongation factor 4 [Candidatus Parcubacteria bacterium]HNZ84145.1 translation elongation factor 4 [Candidatus Pacearchaeota archaeon]HOU46116.1 translation elongation factor 4 [Candidatus Pacearchaeota archaeon]HPM08657.1 translation elongation factor 4 [Candidatus Pacearchaeota archaeon]HQI74676.1 translation elongation factor 4 [Candidatus Pacearchaeota archaeon]